MMKSSQLDAVQKMAKSSATSPSGSRSSPSSCSSPPSHSPTMAADRPAARRLGPHRRRLVVAARAPRRRQPDRGRARPGHDRRDAAHNAWNIATHILRTSASRSSATASRSSSPRGSPGRTRPRPGSGGRSRRRRPHARLHLRRDGRLFPARAAVGPDLRAEASRSGSSSSPPARAGVEMWCRQIAAEFPDAQSGDTSARMRAWATRRSSAAAPARPHSSRTSGAAVWRTTPSARATPRRRLTPNRALRHDPQGDDHGKARRHQTNDAIDRLLEVTENPRHRFLLQGLRPPPLPRDRRALGGDLRPRDDGRGSGVPLQLRRHRRNPARPRADHGPVRHVGQDPPVDLLGPGRAGRGRRHLRRDRRHRPPADAGRGADRQRDRGRRPGGLLRLQGQDRDDLALRRPPAA